jgi:hypothetical protein
MKMIAKVVPRRVRRIYSVSTLVTFVAGLLLVGVVSRPELSAQETKSANPAKILIFRNIPSWDRSPDFEDSCRTLKFAFDVKRSAEMKTARLSDYRVVVVPGAQWQTGYYAHFADAAAMFEKYVEAGGVLLLELNGAEREGITLPGGPKMVPHEGFDNLIVMPQHPAVAPLASRPHVYAQLASHGYLEKVSPDALVLATVSNGAGVADKSKPTYIEYQYGKGRVIAACQCFHDRDESGRGPLMPASLSYALSGKWHLPP